MVAHVNIHFNVSETTAIPRRKLAGYWLDYINQSLSNLIYFVILGAQVINTSPEIHAVLYKIDKLFSK